LEILVVDDASSDNSVAVIEKIAAEDPRIRLIRHETNRRAATAWNTIISNATGEFIALQDDDDESYPERLREQWHRITSYESKSGADLVLCYSDRDLVTPDGVIHASEIKAIGRSAPEPYGPAVADFVLWRNFTPGYVWGEFGSCTMMARRSVFMAVDMFDTGFKRSAEWDLAVRLALKGGHFIAVGKPLLRQYVTSGADKATPIRLEAALSLRRKHQDYLRQRRLYLASIAATHARYNASNKRPWRSRFFLGLACLANPAKVVPSVLRNAARKRGLRT
jgi:glycosyltransferase involved in cell wall biosynthesis